MNVDEAAAQFCPCTFPRPRVCSWDDLEDRCQQLEGLNSASKRVQVSGEHENMTISLNDVSERDKNKWQSCFRYII